MSCVLLPTAQAAASSRLADSCLGSATPGVKSWELGAGGKTNKIDTFIIIDGQVVEESEDTLRVFKFQTNFLDIFIWLNKLFSMKFINILTE